MSDAGWEGKKKCKRRKLLNHLIDCAEILENVCLTN